MPLSPCANAADHALAGTFETREADWRMGAVVYQVLVDRFAPSASLDAKRHLYPAPKVLRGWDELPAQGHYLEAHRLWSHEIEFWGGDLASTAAHLDHVVDLGADVLYLNPIHLAYTNHKYDALDYLQVSPEFGTRDDVKALANAAHQRGLKLVLDGVFNHMGRNAPAFQAAAADPAHPQRDWFVFDDTLPGGARCWWRAENLPELNLENPAVRAHVYGAHDSAVRSYLRDGIDGWRLDVAFDIGPAYLQALTHAAHAEKPGSLVVGELANYPKEWFPAVDGVMHFGLRQMILRLCNGQLPVATFGAMFQRLVDDCGVDNLLRSWIYLDNHDTARLATTVPDAAARRLAQVLQFTLPGSPNLYYGGEIDMAGGNDPAMRAPMRWQDVHPGNAALQWTRHLVALHRGQRALRVGNHRAITTTRLLGYERHTDRVADTVVVLLNPSPEPVRETVLVGNSKLMDGTRWKDLLAGTPNAAAGAPPPLWSGLMDVELPPWGTLVLQPDTTPLGGYTNYKRVQ
ncbi:MAG: alpha-amylase family glycosyl hydrolase [Rubrivivax sp.]|jgi:glycosidase